MSCNIDTFKLKKLEGFIVPIASLFKNERGGWSPKRINKDNRSVKFTFGDTSYIEGTLLNGYLQVTDMCVLGEGSGTAMIEILQPAFKDSTGKLTASCVWEGGDTINRLEVEGGNFEWVDIEI